MKRLQGWKKIMHMGHFSRAKLGGVGKARSFCIIS